MWVKAATTDAESERERAFRRLARAVAAESIVLLENDGVLPIAPCPLALYGAGAATTIKGGTGSGEVNERYSVSIEQGLKQAGFTITTDAWLRDNEIQLVGEKAASYQAIAKRILRFNSDDRINIMATDFQYPPGRAITEGDIRESRTGGSCDTALYVIARQAGECTDRSLDERGYCLSRAELDHLETLTVAYERVIVAINVGGQMDLSALEEIPGINALLFFCQQGSEGGNALADILTGKVTPSGCLSASWPRRYEDLPHAMEYSHLGGPSPDEYYREGIYVGYRYFDSFDVAPRYAFGYGASYTDFAMECLDVSVDGTEITVTVKVANTGGTFSGKKCVQLYASAPNGRLHREFQSLVAFAKTGLLEPGGFEELQLGFDITDLAAYDEKSANFILEAGDYLLRLGENSRTTEVVAMLGLAHAVTTEVCSPVCRLERSLDEIKPPESSASRAVGPPEGIRRLTIDPGAIITETHSYHIPEPALSPEAKQVLDSLDFEDMRRIVIATGIMDTRPHICVPGAAAYTTSHLVERGIPNMALCDGPAGVRVQKTSVKLKNGKVKPVEAMMEFMNHIPWYLQKFILGNPAKGELLHQFATAFPVGTALAQTWNSELIEQVGTAMGVELAEFGGTFLLA
ncbi:MAG TPA: hypothetical protein DEB24_02475, partial [Coriobacteriia bacterium]|nr:hypothetical protein [Coriobacteriia bacterium]